MLTYSIELSAEKIYHPRTKEYFKEVLQSFINGSNRSAVVMLYSVVVSDLVYKLQELESLYGDRTAIDILNNIKEMQEKNPRSSEWEVYLISEVIDRTSLLDEAGQINLEYLRNQRHLSAHPVLNQENLLVKPNDETVRSLIRNTLESILTKNPILSRNVFNLLLQDMAENQDSLITNKLLKKYLDSKYLKNLNNKILNILFKDLWKITFNCSSEPCTANREINVRVLTILYHENRSSNQRFFNENKSFFKITYEEDILLMLTEFIGNNPEIYDFLEEHEKLKLNDKIKGNIRLRLRSPFLQSDMESHFKHLTSVIAKHDSTILLEYQLTSNEIDILKKWAVSNEVLTDYYYLLINLFTKSRSFNSADSNYRLYIQKNLEEFNADHFRVLLDGIDSNPQCNKRMRSKQDNTEILSYAKGLLDPEFDCTIEYPNIEFSEVELMTQS